jgi:nucleotide-binding universal stress UspA family protein
MFSRILVPVDGCELAEKACRAAIDFAKEVGHALPATTRCGRLPTRRSATASSSP